MTKKQSKRGTKSLLGKDSGQFTSKMLLDRLFYLLRRLPQRKHKELIQLTTEYIRQVENDPMYRASR